jgi:hypothetical protein
MALLESVILTPDTRANQPAANTVAVGTLYCVTDEGDILERSNGATWDPYSPAGGGGGTIGGSTGGTDEAVLVADGTGGATLKATPVIIDSATGLITFPDGVRQTFNPNGTTPGLNVGSQAGDPSTPSNGDLWYDSTGHLLRARINGASVSLGAGGGGGSSPWPAFTTPVDGDYSWVNQGSASTSVGATGGIYLSSPGTGGGGDNVRMRVKSAPSTPYVVTAAFFMDVVLVDYHSAGILFRESGTGKIRTLTYGYNSASPSGAMRIRVYGFNNPTTYSGFVSVLTQFPTASLMWFQIANDGTDLSYGYSVDGVNFRTFLTEAKTAGFTTAPDQIGFGVNTGGDPTNSIGVTLMSWDEA